MLARARTGSSKMRLPCFLAAVAGALFLALPAAAEPEVLATVSVDPALRLAVDSQLGRVFVTHGGTPGAISVLDGTTGALVNTFSPGPTPSAVAYNAVTGRLYVHIANDMAMFDSTYALLASTSGSSFSVRDLEVDEDHNRLLGAGTGGPAVVVDGATLAQTTPPGQTIRGEQVAVNGTTDRYYIGGATPSFFPVWGSLLAYDGATNQLVAQQDFGSTAPAALAVDEGLDKVYASFGCCPGVRILAYDGTLGNATPVFEGKFATRMAVDSVAHLTYLAMVDGTTFASSLVVLDTTTDTIVVELPLSSSHNVRSIEVDESTHRAYVLEGASQVHIIGEAPSADTDGDGVLDAVDPNPLVPSGDFDDGDGTTGSLAANPDGLTVTIEDAGLAEDGVQITVGAGTGQVTVVVCGGFTVKIDPESTITLSCGSVRLAVAVGHAQVVLGSGLAIVDVPAGAEARVDEVGGRFTVENLGGAVSVTVDGIAVNVPPGPARTFAAWDFVGFASPVDNAGVLNVVKAGKAVPLKWRALDAQGAPVLDLATASVSVQSLPCSSGVTEDQLEEVATGASGLQNLGNGYYQFNWATPKGYAGSCKTMRLDIGDGVTHNALFRFVK